MKHLQRNSVHPLAALPVLMALLLAGCASPAPAPAEPVRILTVTGSGMSAGQADIAILNFGFWTKDEDANIALLNSKTKLAEATAQLAALGVAQDDIQVLAVSVGSESIYGPDGYPTDRLLYSVNQSINVTLRDLTKLGTALNMIREVAGAPYIYGLGVVLDLSQEQRTQLLSEAQAKAVEDGHAIAARLAQAMGATLGDPTSAKVVNQQVMPGQVQVTMEASYEIQ
jgi:uncharacterized protein